MKKLILPLILLSLIFSCEQSTNTTKTTIDEPELNIYGDQEMTKDNAIEGAELLSLLTKQDSVDVKLEANIVSVCQMKGCWMDVALNDSTEMLVRFKDYAFFVPMDCDGKKAIVQGVAKKVTHSVEWLKHKAADAGKSQDEIDAITQEKVAFSIDEATGVIIQ